MVLASNLATAWAITAWIVPVAFAQEPPPHRRLDRETVAQIRDAHGREPFAMFAEWARGSVDFDTLRFLDRSLRPETLRDAFAAAAVCGLWSDGPDVAFGAACHVDERCLDLGDIDRLVAVLRPHLFDARMRFDWDVFKHVLSTEQVGEVLGGRPAAASDARQIFIGDLHRSFRAEHVPALCLRVRDPDPVVREQAFDALANLSTYHGRYRESVALELLAWPGEAAFDVVDYDDPKTNPPYVPRDFELPPPGGGYPPILKAVLQRWLIELGNAPAHGMFGPWLARWARDAQPSGADRELVLALLRSPVPHARWIGLRAVWQLGDVGRTDAGIAAALRAITTGEEAVPTEIAAAARDLGDLSLSRDLGLGGDLMDALGVVIEPADESAWGSWAARAFGDDEEAGLHSLLCLVEMVGEAWPGPILAPDGLGARLRGASDAALERLGPARAFVLIEHFPVCRSRGLADVCLDHLEPDSATLEVLAVLETHDAARLRSVLDDWLRSTDAEQRRVAALALLRLGAPEVGAELVAELAAMPDSDEVDRVLLGRSAASPAVFAALCAALPEAFPSDGDADLSAVAAILVADGVSELAARAWVRELGTAPRDEIVAAWPEWMRLCRDGEAFEVFVESLPAVFGAGSDCEGLGLCADPRVVAHLRALRTRPGAQVQDVIAELAVAGDADARAEMAEVRRRHLYGWMDDASPHVRTQGPSLDLVPYWIDELATVCCRRNGAAVAIESLLGFDPQQFPEGGLRTQAERTRAFWEEFSAYLRPSRIAGHWVVAPHD